MNAHSADGSVVIVGAGIIGLACAHYLAADGYKVTVLDKGTIAGACSHGNCGHILPSHILPLNAPGAIKTAIFSLFDKNAPFRVKPQFNTPFWNWMFQFARHCTHSKMLAGARHLQQILDSAFNEYEKLISDKVIDCGWQKSGLLYVFKSQAALDGFSKTDALLSDEFGLAAKRLEAEELTVFDKALKPDLSGGYLYENDALLRPEMLAKSWSNYLKTRGVVFVENCNVTGVEKSGKNVAKLVTSMGNVDVDQLVVATGALTGEFAKQLECVVPVLAGKGYSITVPRPDVCPRTAIVLPEKNVAITPFADGLRIGSMMEFVGFDDSLPEYRMVQLRSSAKNYLRADISGEGEQWFGWRPMTWDTLPIIGRLQSYSNVAVATGHGMMGVMQAPATGRLIAEIIGERTCHIPDAPYSLARF